MIGDRRRWAREVAETYPEIALVLLVEPPEAAASRDLIRICLVMRDGSKVPWFAEGKGIEGLVCATVPGYDVRERTLEDPRFHVPGLRLYMNFCDPRALIFTYESGREKLAGDEMADFRYRILYPELDRIPPLEEFFHLWGDPLDAADSGCRSARK